ISAPLFQIRAVLSLFASFSALILALLFRLRTFPAIRHGSHLFAALTGRKGCLQAVQIFVSISTAGSVGVVGTPFCSSDISPRVALPPENERAPWGFPRGRCFSFWKCYAARSSRGFPPSSGNIPPR